MGILDKIVPTPENLVKGLLVLQSGAGYLGDEAMEEAARYFGVSRREVEEAAAFYGALKRKKPGARHIVLCRGRLCTRKHAKELEGVIQAAAERDAEVTLEYVDCLGGCGSGPVLLYNGQRYTHMTPPKLKKLLKRKSPPQA